MAYEIITPNMGLTVPSAGLTSGPQFALDINNSLTILDQHNHTPGSGVAITPLAIDINSDLTFAGNNATFLRTTRFSPQSTSPAGVNDKGCLYVLGVDLYYNDESGNVIRLTQSGSIVGTSGSITGLTSPASASYSSVGSSFIWQSGTNTAANMDMGSIILRNLTAGSNGVTISPPATLSTNYTLTLPVIPPAVDMMVMDTAGNMSNAFVGPALFLDPTGAAGEPYTIDVALSGVTQAYLAPRAVTSPGVTVPAGGIGQSVNLNGTINNGTLQLGTVVLTCTGRPVQIIISSNTVSGGGIIFSSAAQNCFLEITKNGGIIYSSGSAVISWQTITSINFIDYNLSSGAHTYGVQIHSTSAGTTITSVQMIMTAFEIN